MAKYIVRGQMYLRHDGQRFYPGAAIELPDGSKAPSAWEKVAEKAESSPSKSPPDDDTKKPKRPSDKSPI